MLKSTGTVDLAGHKRARYIAVSFMARRATYLARALDLEVEVARVGFLQYSYLEVV